jgi:hypothetical protein
MATPKSSGTRQMIPAGKKWTGIFPGEYFGNIFAAKNISLDAALGKVSVADSMSAVANNTTLTNLTAPVAFLRTAADGTDRYWANGGKLFKSTNTDPTGTWAQDAIASTPTAPLWDLIEFSSSMYVPTDTDIAKLTAGTWTAAFWTGLAGASALQSGKPHRFAILAGALLITDGRYVNTYDGTIAADPALTLPSQFDAQFILVTSDVAYICTKSLNAGNAEVFAWDRTATVYNARYDSGDSEIVAGFVAGGLPFIITKRGEIKRFNGQGFVRVAAFPTVELGKTINNINPNGVGVDGRLVRIFVDFGAISDFRLRSGMWTFELDTGNLYHSGSVKNNVGKDYAQLELATAGALKVTLPSVGKYLIGAQPYKTYTASTMHGIFKLDGSSTASQPAYIITPKIKASNVRRFWRAMFVRFNNFLNSTDRIRVAYRITDSTTLPAVETITWVNATSFTGTNTNVAIGDFVEILAGDNAGAIAKITNITGSGTLTFTIDLTLNNVTTAARAMYMRFIDLGTVSSQAVQEQIFRPMARANWIQYFVELRGGITSPQVEELIPDGDDVAY